MATGYGITMDAASFLSQQWGIIVLLLFIILIAGVFAVLSRGGD
jgi:F0F1-type ATP synthase assembly protein I